MDRRGLSEGRRLSYRFDDVEIDPESFRVTRGGEPVRLEPKAIELLLHLAANPGRLVTKSEIQAAVWRDAAVTENALTRLVAQIRRGLGDDAREARYIETVPTRGYRFVARLDGPGSASSELNGHGATADASAGTPAPPRPWRTGLRIAAVLSAVLAAALAVLAVRRAANRPPMTVIVSSGAAAPLFERQVSTAASLNLFPRFSPDGASIAYSTLRAGSMEIVLRALAPGAREVPITSDGTQNVEPAFSPDGRLIAFHSVARGGIWLIPSLGGLPRRLTRFGSWPAWSPDGSRIAFQGQSWVGDAEGRYAAGEGSTLWLVSSHGGEPQPLTAAAGVGAGGHGAPAWSPDGRLIAFLAGARVMAVRPDGSNLRETSDQFWATGVAWEPAGRSQIWTGSLRGNWVVWRVPVSPETGEVTGQPRTIAGGGEGASAWSHPALSPDGRSITHVTFRTRYEIRSQAVTTDGRPAGEPQPFLRDVAGRKLPLGFSPDGRRFAFGTVRPGVGRSLWVADVASGEAKPVVEESAVNWVSGWFPDGRRLGFLRMAASPAVLCTVDVDTGEVRERRSLERQLGWPPNVLSPDGRRIAWHDALGGALNLWLVDLADGSPRRLTDDNEGVGWPVWSPDGSHLAVEMMRGGDTHIGWLPAAGGPIRELVSTPGQSWPHSFSPDGRRISFAGQRRGVWNVYSVPVEGGPERRVTGYSTPDLYVRYPQWSPGGDRIVYEYADSTSTVWIADLSPR